MTDAATPEGLVVIPAFAAGFLLGAVILIAMQRTARDHKFWFGFVLILEAMWVVAGTLVIVHVAEQLT